MLDDSGARLALTADNHLAVGEELIPDWPWFSRSSLPHAGDRSPAASGNGEAPPQSAAKIAYLQYTSGSTRSPAGVVISHGNVLAQTRAVEAAFELGGEVPSSLIWLPWYHDYGLIHGLVEPVSVGATGYFLPVSAFLRDPLNWPAAIARYRVSHSGAPNFAYAMCVQALAAAPEWEADLSCWRLASCGAEPIQAETLQRFEQAFAPHGLRATALSPCYGLAEAVLVVSGSGPRQRPSWLCADAEALAANRLEIVTAPHTRESSAIRQLVSCGPPLPGFTVQIVDPDTARRCPAGVIGEIWVAGPSVAERYWRPREDGVPPFGATLADGDDGRAYLRTGDLGVLHDGELYLAGRRKELIVLQGRNFHPADIEAAVQRTLPELAGAAVFAIETEQDQRTALTLLLEVPSGLDGERVSAIVTAVRTEIASVLDADVREVVPLRPGTLPRTSSGKPQRMLARERYLRGDWRDRIIEQSNTAVVAAAPAALLDAVWACWEQVFGAGDRRQDPDLFDAGADSLRVTQLVNRLQERLDGPVGITDVFNHPTPRRLAAALHDRGVRVAAGPGPWKGSGEPAPQAQRTLPGFAGAPLSFAQQRMWFMHELAPRGAAYNIPLALSLEGELDESLLQRALDHLVARHDSLRTVFRESGGGVAAYPLIEDYPAIRIDRRRGVADEGLDATLAALACEPFELDRGPLLRATLLSTVSGRRLLLLVMHHIIGDQWSCAVIGRELATLYNGLRRDGALPALPPAPAYADYARWHQDWFEDRHRERELAYWKAQLAGLEPLRLATDRPRPPQQSFQGASVKLTLGESLLDRLKARAARSGSSLNMLLLAALNVLLHRYANQSDIAVGVPIANRNHPRTEQLVGTCVNTLVLRTRCDGDTDFDALLAQVRQTALAAYDHQNLPFELLVQELALTPDLSHSALFDVMLNMVSAPVEDIHFEGLRWHRHEFERGAAQFDLTFTVDPVLDRSLVVEYATELFDRATVAHMAQQYLELLGACAAGWSGPVSRMPMLPAREREQLERWSRGPRRPVAVSRDSLATRLDAALERHASRSAVICEGQQVSYAALRQRVDAWQSRLPREAPGTRLTLGLCLPRNLDMVAALLAVMLRGDTAVPLDPTFPADRIAHQVADSGLSLILTDARLQQDHGFAPERTVRLDAAAPPAMPATAAATAGPPPAYVMYTSGSSGAPKGVAIGAPALLNLLDAMNDLLELEAEHRWLAVTTLSFDIALLEILLPLLRGAAIVLATDTEARDGARLGRLIETERVSHLQATPSRWRMLVQAAWQAPAPLVALSGGEPLSDALIGDLLPRCRMLWNVYGPTETTIWSAAGQIDRRVRQTVSLGQPLANTWLEVVAPDGSPCPIGVPGEIRISGAGLAGGYLHQPELTAERFVMGTGLDGLTRRWYHTGDRARRRADGALEFLGRLDSQVKLRGFRIELGEIETALCRLPGVREAVAVVDSGEAGAELAAAVVCDTGAGAPQELRDALRRWLPDHMVPAQIESLPTLPRLPNGKLNRAALAALLTDRRQRALADAPDRPPSDDLEHRLWLLWRDALQSSRFDIDSNFFDLGGHSLMALRLAKRIALETAIDCTPADLFLHPTVARLAAELQGRNGRVPGPHGTVVPLNGHGGRPVLFLFSAVEQYRSLAAQLEQDIAVCGVVSRAELEMLDEGSGLRELSIPELARDYLELVRQQQPRGPYFLAGFSIGGHFAFETARLLAADGEQVAYLGLIDSALPGLSTVHLWHGVRRQVLRFQRDGFAAITERVRRRRADGANDDSGQQRIQAYARAIRRYRAQPYGGPAVFYQSVEDPLQVPGYGWGSLIDGLEVVPLAGPHMEMLEGANVERLAGHLRERVRQALTAEAAATHPRDAASAALQEAR